MAGFRMTATAVSCGGVDVFVGVWLVTATPRLVLFELVEPPLGDGAAYVYEGIKAMRCPVSNSGPHCLRVWGDGEYTVYPHRNGTPYHFKPERPVPRPRTKKRF